MRSTPKPAPTERYKTTPNILERSFQVKTRVKVKPVPKILLSQQRLCPNDAPLVFEFDLGSTDIPRETFWLGCLMWC